MFDAKNVAVVFDSMTYPGSYGCSSANFEVPMPFPHLPSTADLVSLIHGEAIVKFAVGRTCQQMLATEEYF